MSFGSRGNGSPAAAVPDGVTNHRLVDLPAADLVAHLIGCNSRASDFVDAALVLAARERRLVEAEARVRAADDAAGRLANEIAALGCRAAEADAQIHLAAEREALLQAQIREWQRRAAEAEARLQANVDGPPAGTDDDSRGHEAEIRARDGVPGPSWLMLSTGAALPAAEPAPVLQATTDLVDLSGDGDAEANKNKAQAAEEGPVPLLVVSGKRKKELVVWSGADKGADEDDDGRTTSPIRHGLKKKLKPRGGRCRPSQNAVTESEPIAARDEAEAEEEEGRDHLPEASPGIGGGDVPEERTRTDTDDDEPAETETGGVLLLDTQVSPAAIHSGSTARRNNGRFSYYKMVFRALKEKEKKQLALAAALANEPAAATAVAGSQLNLICAACTSARSVGGRGGRSS